MVYCSNGLGGSLYAGVCTTIGLLVVCGGQHLFGAADTRTHCEAAIWCLC